jgi:nucleoside-diphosphate-sugar epimerase
MDESAGWRGLRVLVTGGTRFLGEAAVELLLASGAEVIGLVRDRAAAATLARHQIAGRVRMVHGRSDDLFRVHSAMAIHEVHRVLHFPAADSAAADRSIITLLEATRKYDPRIPVVIPRSGSSASLIASPVPLGIARFDELFGPDPDSRGSLSAAVTRLMVNEFPPLNDGAPRDYVHAKDAARACLLLAEAVAKHPVPHVREARFRSGWQFTERQLFAAVREALAGRTPLLPFVAAPTNPLDWSPSLHFGEAIADTVEWLRTRVARSVRTRVAA